MTSAYCDGFEVRIAHVPKKTAQTAKFVLLDLIQSHLVDLIVKNMLISARAESIYIWFTLNPETARISPRTMNELSKVLGSIRLHARSHWGLDPEQCQSFELTKVDVAVDYKGAFMKNKYL